MWNFIFECFFFFFSLLQLDSAIRVEFESHRHISLLRVSTKSLNHFCKTSPHFLCWPEARRTRRANQNEKAQFKPDFYNFSFLIVFFFTEMGMIIFFSCLIVWFLFKIILRSNFLLLFVWYFSKCAFSVEFFMFFSEYPIWFLLLSISKVMDNYSVISVTVYLCVCAEIYKREIPRQKKFFSNKLY